MQLTQITTDGTHTHVKIAGKLDLQGAMQLDPQLTAAVATRRLPTMIEMTDVDFLASLGMRALLSNAKALKREDCKIALINPQPEVRNALAIAGLDKITPIFDTQENALQFILQSNPGSGLPG